MDIDYAPTDIRHRSVSVICFQEASIGTFHVQIIVLDVLDGSIEAE